MWHLNRDNHKTSPGKVRVPYYILWIDELHKNNPSESFFLPSELLPPWYDSRCPPSSDKSHTNSPIFSQSTQRSSQVLYSCNHIAQSCSQPKVPLLEGQFALSHVTHWNISYVFVHWNTMTSHCEPDSNMRDLIKNPSKYSPLLLICTHWCWDTYHDRN